MTNEESKTQAMRNASTVNVELQERQVLYVAPDNEVTRRWGVHGLPEMYRAEDGSIVIYDPGRMDTYDRGTGTIAEAFAFRSTNEGKSWQKADFATYGEDLRVHELSDGAQVRFRKKEDMVDLHALGVKEEGLVMTPNEGGLQGIFRYGDIPLSARSFERRFRPDRDSEWEIGDARLEIPELRVRAVVKAKKGDALWPDIPPRFSSLHHSFIGLYESPSGHETIAELPDGTWLSVIVNHAPTENNAQHFTELHCMASQDKGKTWQKRGSICDQRELSRFGATPEFSIIQLGDETVCAFRMDYCSRDPHDETRLARSTDGGMTWSYPEAVAESSVTPHLVKLDNGVVALVYGRPGVHVQFSTDGCRSWNTLTSIIGKTKTEELTDGRDIMQAKYWDSPSYSNTRTVVTGPDRFVVVYTDFKYGGEKRKATMVQEIVVSKK